MEAGSVNTEGTEVTEILLAAGERRRPPFRTAVDVHQQANFAVVQPQLRKALRFVHRQQPLDRVHLENPFV
jgi:hypothetical protein